MKKKTPTTMAKGVKAGPSERLKRDAAVRDLFCILLSVVQVGSM